MVIGSAIPRRAVMKLGSRIRDPPHPHTRTLSHTHRAAPVGFFRGAKDSGVIRLNTLTRLRRTVAGRRGSPVKNLNISTSLSVRDKNLSPTLSPLGTETKICLRFVSVRNKNLSPSETKVVSTVPQLLSRRCPLSQGLSSPLLVDCPTP